LSEGVPQAVQADATRVGEVCRALDSELRVGVRRPRRVLCEYEVIDEQHGVSQHFGLRLCTRQTKDGHHGDGPKQKLSEVFLERHQSTTSVDCAEFDRLVLHYATVVPEIADAKNMCRINDLTIFAVDLQI
jgi:hypothetical protein